MKEDKCCTVNCDLPLDQTYWDNQYKAHATGWDLGRVSPPLTKYIDSIENKDAKILIPGCGNTYEAEYLLEKGFTNITVIDIAPTLVANIRRKFATEKNIRVILGDFFEHSNLYDYIIEQTFFCALPPMMRPKYVWKMHQLLAPQGLLVGLLFNREFKIGPPFGGNLNEYETLFRKAFNFKNFATAQNSVASRANTELFFEFEKNASAQVHLYYFEGITCSGCMETVSGKFMEITGVKQVNMNSNYSQLVITSQSEVGIEKLQKIVSYDEKYKIHKAK